MVAHLIENGLLVEPGEKWIATGMNNRDKQEWDHSVSQPERCGNRLPDDR
jgi:hypothetical protein